MGSRAAFPIRDWALNRGEEKILHENFRGGGGNGKQAWEGSLARCFQEPDFLRIVLGVSASHGSYHHRPFGSPGKWEAAAGEITLGKRSRGSQALISGYFYRSIPIYRIYIPLYPSIYHQTWSCLTLWTRGRTPVSLSCSQPGDSNLSLPCHSSVQEGWESVSRWKSPWKLHVLDHQELSGLTWMGASGCLGTFLQVLLL